MQWDLNFGSVPIGTSVSEHLQIQNTGNEELLISGFSLNDESIPFSISEENITISPGESYFLSITFSNLKRVIYGQLVIESNSFGFNASTYINLEALGYQSYFDSVNPTGLPYSIIINDVNIDNHSLQNGDEIGFFDTDATGEEICVGSFRYSNQDYPIQTVVWEADTDFNLSGFNTGNNINIKLWASTYETLIELVPNITINQGDGTYGNGEFSVLSLEVMSGLNPVMNIEQKVVSIFHLPKLIHLLMKV